MNRLHRLQRDLLLSMHRAIFNAEPHFGHALSGQYVFFSNHTSHLDTLSLLAALPPSLRDLTRPVAGLDYWDKSGLRRHIARKLLHAVLIDRDMGGKDAIAPLETALDDGASLIVFPEGTRLQARLPGPFKTGLFHLTKNRPGLALVPVYQENMHRALPKGALLPLPLLCQTCFGAPVYNNEAEGKDQFLMRAHQAVCDLASLFAGDGS